MASIGDHLAALGVTADLDDGDLIASAVVVLTVLVPDSSMPRLVIAASEGLSWIEQAGMVRLAERITSDMPDNDDDDL